MLLERGDTNLDALVLIVIVVVVLIVIIVGIRMVGFRGVCSCTRYPITYSRCEQTTLPINQRNREIQGEYRAGLILKGGEKHLNLVLETR